MFEDSDDNSPKNFMTKKKEKQEEFKKFSNDLTKNKNKNLSKIPEQE